MANIELRRKGDRASLVVNGMDLSMEVYRDIELVEVGDDPETAEVGLRVTLAVSHLDLDTESDVRITDRFPVIAQRVRSVVEADEDAD